MEKTLKTLAPLFRDPIYDGAADPVVIWNNEEKCWCIAYSNRRANINCPGLSHFYATDIGVACSKDGGQTWFYRGTLQGLEFESGRNTFWAPEIIWDNGMYHMYVSYIRGVYFDWSGERSIIHYTSQNFWDWKFEDELNLSSNYVIDACVIKMPSGNWRMWYKDEAHGSHTFAADSEDLYNWKVIGDVIDDCAHEGPNVFSFKGYFWMLTDPWEGIGVYRSIDAVNWERRKNILDIPGNRKDDNVVANHADVLVEGDNAYIFYHTQPGWQYNFQKEIDVWEFDWKYEQKRSSLQVAQLEVIDNELVCNRNKPFELIISYTQ